MVPYVSAVMPTKTGRTRYALQSIQLFLKQTFPDAELVILSDEYDPELDFSARTACDKVRYYDSAPGYPFATTGEKRNGLNKLVLGRIIIHWDDDDWYAPERIATQVAHLITSGKRVVGCHDLLFYREKDGGLFKYRFSGTGPYATGTSQCYWTEHWQENQFLPVKVGSDSQFSLRASGKGLLASCDSRGIMVARNLSDSVAKPGLGGHDFPTARRDEFPPAFFTDLEIP